MITLVVKDRSPLLGTLRASDGNHSEPWVEFTALGHEVLKLWQGIPNYHPEIKMLRLCIMPDHIHGILHVTQPLSCHLGNVINGFKKGCNDITRETLGEVLWEPDYHDRILSGKGQLDAMFQYIGDTPRRLWMKRTTPRVFYRSPRHSSGQEVPCGCRQHLFVELPAQDCCHLFAKHEQR